MGRERKPSDDESHKHHAPPRWRSWDYLITGEPHLLLVVRQHSGTVSVLRSLAENPDFPQDPIFFFSAAAPAEVPELFGLPIDAKRELSWVCLGARKLGL